MCGANKGGARVSVLLSRKMADERKRGDERQGRGGTASERLLPTSNMPNIVLFYVSFSILIARP